MEIVGYNVRVCEMIKDSNEILLPPIVEYLHRPYYKFYFPTTLAIISQYLS